MACGCEVLPIWLDPCLFQIFFWVLPWIVLGRLPVMVLVLLGGVLAGHIAKPVCSLWTLLYRFRHNICHRSNYVEWQNILSLAWCVLWCVIYVSKLVNWSGSVSSSSTDISGSTSEGWTWHLLYITSSGWSVVEETSGIWMVAASGQSVSCWSCWTVLFSGAILLTSSDQF